MKGKSITRAKKKLRNYKMISQYQAGIVLTGSEIKSLKNHQVSIDKAYILSQKNELFITNMYIATYQHSRFGDIRKKEHNTRQKRKLLLHRKEINKLISTIKAKNYILVPLQLFINERG